MKQELSYRKQIARQLHTQYDEGINSNPVTLKCGLRLTEPLDRSYTTYPLVELFDVAYYRDLEIWVRGHSRSLKLVPFESPGSYSPSIVTMTLYCIVCEI